MHLGWKDVITFAFAAVGAVLGVINTWNAINQRKVRLRVVPKSSFSMNSNGPLKEGVCIEVVNLSAFPVSLSEIGFTLKGGSIDKRRQVIPNPFTSDGLPIARTLAPRHGVTGYFEQKSLSADIVKAYARTECGEVSYGDSPALKKIRAGLYG